MPYDTKRYWLGFLPDALIASQVGIWETDFANDRTVADSITAALFGLDPVQAAIGLPLAAYTKAILPADQNEFFANIDRVCEHGGLFVVEYRVRSADRGVRWVLARGHYKRNPRTGKVLGRGIVVDITEGKLNGQVEDRALFVSPNKNEAPLDQIATYALKARRAVDDVAGHEKTALRSAIDGLLWAVGRALAKRSRC
ncbi:MULTISPECIES: PAS domain-containing protein [Methylobacteriaceae]|uniref:PAS domain-containing protein n=1 Tax=Methylobacteriaceae TaxID=119045 RepID=UPI00074F8C1E|nr:MULTISPECIES: PAS domain-containing protein [Methylobacteriaceae]AMB48220.1 PAS domain-containing protein [Methylobacterium sp. AMS5]TFZ55844.1 diguanylate cyclase [Methylorubrum sp. Q1]